SASSSRARRACSGGATRISSGLRGSDSGCAMRGAGYRQLRPADSVAQQPHFLAPLAREEVNPVREAYPVAAGAHQERVRARGVREEAHAAQEFTVRHAGRRDDLLARRELLRHEDTRGIVDSELARLLDLAPGCRPQLRLHLAAETAEGSRGHDRLARPADPDGEAVIRA